MPSSTLPTGTVSRGSQGARTFPSETEPTSDRERPRTGPDPNWDRSARSAAAQSGRGESERSARSGPALSAPVSSSATTASLASESAGSSPPNARALNPSAANAPARIAELERENDELRREVAALRDRLRRKREGLQDVIDRYEGLLAEAKRSSGSNRSGRPSRRDSSGAHFGGVRSRLSALGDRTEGLFDQLFGSFDRR